MEKSTHVRYGVLGFLSALSFILYLDRVCISKAALNIENDLGLSHTAMGFVFGAFTIAYGLFEVPTGAWGDRYGSRGVLTRIVIWWSLFTALTGCVYQFSWKSGFRVHIPGIDQDLSLVFDSFILLMIVRFLFGAGEAGAFPNAARVLAHWFPLRERGMAQGFVLTCSLLGGAAAPTAAGYLIQDVGWRWTFAIFGSVGIVWAAAFYYWFRDDPAEHSAVNDGERQFILDGNPPASVTDHHPPIPWKIVLASPNVWLLGGVITCGAFTAYMFMTWYPTYLQKGRGVSSIEAGWLSSLVLAGGAVGCFCGGYLSGWIVRLTGERKRSRRMIGICTLGSAGLLLGACTQFESPVVTSLCAALAFGCAQAQQGNWWATVTDISGKHLGAMFGLMNSLGVPGAFISPIFLGGFVDWRNEHGYVGRGQWDPGFYVYATVLLIGACCWVFIEPTKSIVERDQPR